MQKLSLRKPANELIENIKDTEELWKQFSSATAAVPYGKEIPMIIGGEKIYTDQKMKSLNPSTKEVLCTFQQGSAKHGEMAAAAAMAAKPAWAALSPSARVQKFRDLEFVLAKWKWETMATAAIECGYNANECSASWAEMMDFLRFNNYYYTEILSEQMGDGTFTLETNQTQLRPLKGFTCAVTPFNFPIAIGFNLPLVMALCGNTVVWKPSDDAVFASYLLMLALDEAGFPPGVINFLTGPGPECLPNVLKNPDLSCVNFTGSFNTARIFGNYLFNTEFKRNNFPRFVAETGGKDFLVADNTVDVADTAVQIMQGAFGRSGQKCSSNSVVLPHIDLWPRLKPEVIARAKALQLTSPTERKCDLGPVINEVAFNRIVSFIDRAKTDKNCTILVGGGYSKEKGFFIEPTIIEVNADNHELLNTEIFGPITAVRTWKTLDDAVKVIELHNYRLTGSVVSRSETFLEQAIPVLSQYAGNFYINRRTSGAIVDQQPFGGDGASGTNAKAGGKWYLLNFLSQGSITRRHARTTTPAAFEKVQKF